MDIKLFIALFGTMFIAGAGLYMVVGKMVTGFRQYGKGPLAHFSLTSILGGGAAFLISFLSKDLFNTYILLMLLFTLLGTIHVYILYKKFWSKPNKNNYSSELVYTLSIMLVLCVVFGALAYFIQDRNFMYFPMLLSILAFFLPYFIHKTFEKAIQIPQKMYQKWYYPVHNPLPEPEDDEMKDLIVIGFEMEKNTGDGSRTYFRARAPQRMDLSALFYHFINDYNDSHSETPIQIVSNNGRPFAWLFEKKRKWYQFGKVYNPLAPISNNGIKENTVIICKRIIETNIDDE